MGRTRALNEKKAFASHTPKLHRTTFASIFLDDPVLLSWWFFCWLFWNNNNKNLMRPNYSFVLTGDRRSTGASSFAFGLNMHSLIEWYHAAYSTQAHCCSLLLLFTLSLHFPFKCKPIVIAETTVHLCSLTAAHHLIYFISMMIFFFLRDDRIKVFDPLLPLQNFVSCLLFYERENTAFYLSSEIGIKALSVM